MNLKNFLKKTSIIFIFIPFFSNAEIIIDNNLNKAESTLLNTIGILNGSKIINVNRNQIILDNKEYSDNYKKEKDLENLEIKKYDIKYTDNVKETPRVIYK